MAAAWIISGQWRSAADKVRNHVGMPNDPNIASTSYNSCCQYGGDPQMFPKNLYASWFLTTCCIFVDSVGF